jgi:hypothetical protein
MSLKQISLLAFSIILIAVNYFWGNAISTLLTVTIVGSCAYYLAQLYTEQLVQNKAKDLAPTNTDGLYQLGQFATQRANLYSLLLYSIVFIFSIIAIKKVVNPTGNNAWFLNNDHHAISNTAIAFTNQLQFSATNHTDSNTVNSSLVFSKQKNGVGIQTNNYYTPIFVEQIAGQKKYSIANPVFKTAITNNFALQNSTTSIAVKLSQATQSWWQQLSKPAAVTYNIQLRCTDAQVLADLHLPNPYADDIVISDEELQYGKSLYNLFVNTTNYTSSKTETHQLLEHLLAQIDDTYLLANYNNAGNKTLLLYPDAQCIKLQYQLVVDAHAESAATQTATTIAQQQFFYIGFNQASQKMSFTNLDNHLALQFNFPQQYLLSHPGQQHIGDNHIRFLTTNFDAVIQTPLQQGFCFTTPNMQSNYTINGQLQYTSNASKHLLNATYTDLQKGVSLLPINKNFWLQTQDAGVQYLFNIRDFSNNGFSYNQLLLYATYLFLLLTAIILFARSKKLYRLEPVVWMVIYALLIVRFIMYWRIATFPPLDNISKHELENTIIGFDFSLFGIALPIPSTLIFVTIIAVIVVAIRYLQNSNSTILSATIFKNKWALTSTATINKVYMLCMLALLLAHTFIHTEILRRLIDIIIPILLYNYFSTLANTYFVEQHASLDDKQNKIITYIKVWLHYLIYNPTFVITISTIAFFAIADRGFCVLFILFVLLKNVLINFLKKSFTGKTNQLLDMFIKPWNYWVYGVAALLVYLLLLGFKSFFYYALEYKFVILLLVLSAITGAVYLFTKKSKLFYSTAIATVLYSIIIAIPFSRNALDTKITDTIKHVQFRASIIHQPISELLVDNAYNDFNTKKIIETAENQWFINTYITKPYDNSKPINLRAFSKVGVNYNTQTRDVVVARFIIAELGNVTMILLLIVMALPMFIYLLSYKLRADVVGNNAIELKSYGGLLPLLLLFTIALFVWLTATNRFVFFGQDFPFLSLTSRVSVLLPMLLFLFTLIQSPVAFDSKKINVQLGFSRYAILFGIVIIVALATVRSNELNNQNFNVEVLPTKQNINGPFNQLLHSIQDSLQAKNISYNYNSLIKTVVADKRYQTFKTERVQDNYTASILTALEKNPSSALRINNPLYIVYDQGKYDAVYNKNLYLELPATENAKVWNGNITEANGYDNNTAFLHYGNAIDAQIQLPFFKNDISNGIQLAILPKAWIANATQPIAIINVMNKTGTTTAISICKNSTKNTIQLSTNNIENVNPQDMVLVNNKLANFQISFVNNQAVFATHKWLNGKYKTIYPQKENNFWMYHFANALKNIYTTDSVLTQPVAITLDYNWMLQTNTLIKKSLQNYKNKGIQFSAIAADGDGNICLLNDYVRNRKIIDPNNDAQIYALQQKHFFYSNTANERDQWANANLIHMHLGPGSSIKPLVAATIASQVNAGWQNIKLDYKNVGNQSSYAGLRLAKPWEADGADSYDGQGMSDYIRKSSNYYHSIVMFLGSYTKADFMDSANQASVKNIVTTNADAKNIFPKITVDGNIYSLPNYNNGKGNWPLSDKSKTSKSYFANENSILANGLEINAGLACKDKDKQDHSVLSNARTNFTDSTMYALLNKNKSTSFIWGFPEESAFAQQNRHYINSKTTNEINENFNLGLKTATLGGYPYQLSAYKMLEMYNALFTQNKNYELHIIPKQIKKAAWMVDSTWQPNEYNAFLANNIFKGMADVITSGTATALNKLKAQHPTYYFYAKTGTINEGGSLQSNSRRLIVCIANKDLTNSANIGNAKVFSYYFVTDNTQDFDWNLLNTIIHTGFTQHSFTHYFYNEK